MFLAPRLMHTTRPVRAKGPGMGLSRQVDITGKFARTPQHMLSSCTPGVGANVSTRADGQAPVPTALDRTGPLARRPSSSQPHGALSWHIAEGRVSPSSSELREHVCLHTIYGPACVRQKIKPDTSSRDKYAERNSTGFDSGSSGLPAMELNNSKKPDKESTWQ